MKLDGYIRVSRIGGRGGEGYISPDVQREAIQVYAQELAAANDNGGELELTFHDEQDVSGGSMERPKFNLMLDRLRAGETDGVIVHKIDRFARRTEAAAIIREVTDRGQIFASVTERIDPRTPTGKFMLRQFLSNSELFLDQVTEGWSIAKARAVERGAHIGPTPIGYKRIPKGQDGQGKLVPHPIYGPAITALFKRAAKGRDGDTALARWLTERAPREAGREWQPSEIRRWLRNRVYLGEVCYGELVNDEAHEPLTDPATWRRCQREPGVQRRAGSPFLLAGLVRCAHCRYAMGGQTHGGGRSGPTPIYRCTNAGACGAPSVIVAKHLEEHITSTVVDRLAGLRLEAAQNGDDLERFDHELEEAETELGAFTTDLNARRVLGEAGWQEGFSVRAADRDAKRQARDDAYSRSKLRQTAQLDVDDLDREAMRDLLTGMIRCVFVRRRPRGATAGDRALVIWSDDTRDLDLPGPHRSGPYEPIRW